MMRNAININWHRALVGILKLGGPELHMRLRVAELFNILHPIRSHSFHLTSHHRQLTGHTERQNPEKNI